MNCKELKELFSAYIDGEISVEEKRLAEEHLASCVQCRDELAAFKNEFDLIAKAVQSQRPDLAALSERIINAANSMPDLENAAPARHILQGRWRILMASTVSTAAGLLIGFILFGSALKEQPVEDMTPPANFRPAPASLPAKKPIATAITTSSGTEMKTAANDWMAYDEHQPLYADCSLRTSDSSKAMLTFDETTELCANSATSLRITGDNSVNLESGEVYLCVKDIPQNCPFVLKTEFGIFSTAGSDSHVVLAEEGVFVSVFSGGIEFAPLDMSRKPLKLEDGTETMIHAGKHISQTPLHYPAYRGILWTTELLYKESPHHPRLSAIVSKLLDKIDSGHMQNLAESDLRSIAPCANVMLSEYILSADSVNAADKRINIARILADTGNYAVVPMWIRLLEDAQPEIRYYSAKGLCRVTGEDFGIKSDFWLNPEPEKLAEAVYYWKQWQMLRDK